MSLSPRAEELRQLVAQYIEILRRNAGEECDLLRDLNRLELERDARSGKRVEQKLAKLKNRLNDETDSCANRCEGIKQKIEKLTSEISRLTQKPLNPDGTQRKTVVHFDMVGYSRVLKTLQGNLGIQEAQHLNDQIADFALRALEQIGIPLRLVAEKGGGDGAIYYFDGATEAFDFCVHFFDVVRAHNANISDKTLAPVFRRYFRIGAATGLLNWKPVRGSLAGSGMDIVEAVRLQSAALPGSLLVSRQTFDELNDDQKRRFDSKAISITGKRGEKFEARSCVLDAEAAKGAEEVGLWKPRASKQTRRGHENPTRRGNERADRKKRR